MDDRLWQRADELLVEALELPPEERTAFVERAAAGDFELATLVWRLLGHAESGESELAPGLRLSSLPARNLLEGGDTGEHEIPTPQGAVVGRYRILDELGRGGMAVVHRAERVDGGFEQQVALKQIRLGFDSPEGVRRFERERQILARATHPDVARLLDGGVGPDGRPFLAMELVEGVPIDQYCDQKRLTVRERLGLFLRVARAVEYAHRNLVVHRDLKPSNILVTDDGHPKLLDFGIAGLLAGPEEDAALTRHDVRPMTPANPSPEQIRGEPVTTLSDVYQLGLLLYLLLTGRTPYRQESSSTPLALARAISEVPPTHPAEALRRTSGEEGDPELAEEIARLRRTSPARLARLLDGDLGSIVLMALRKEPERRYSSVALLAEDIERHLAGRTVAARPDSLWYRARTFTLRHRFAALFAVLLFAALVAFSTATAVQARRLAAERDRANREAEISGQVSRFLAELFKVSDPSEALGNTITAREILDRGSAEIDRRIPEPSLVKARLQRTMGEVYESLGLYPQAEPLLKKAESTAVRTGGERHLETVAARVGLARVYLRTGRYEEAGKLLRPALEIRREALGEEHPETLDVASNLGSLSIFEDRNEEAETIFRRILEARRRVMGPAHLDTLGTANNLATSLFRLNRLEEAEALYREVFEGLRRTQGPDHPRTLTAASNLGSVQVQLRRFDEAEPLLRDTIERRRRVLGAAHPATLTAESNLAGLLEDSGRLAESEALHRRVYEGRRAALGAGHPRTLDSLFDIAYLIAYDPARRHLLESTEFSALAGRSDFKKLKQAPPSRAGQQ